MRTLSNVIARIILFVVGGLIILSAVLEIIGAVKVLNDPAVGWWNFTNETSRDAMLVVLIGGFHAIIGLTAFMAAFTGRRSFWLFVFALLLMVLPIYTVVTQVKAGTLTGTWEQIGKLILEFLTPILYFIGCLLLVRRKSD